MQILKLNNVAQVYCPTTGKRIYNGWALAYGTSVIAFIEYDDTHSRDMYVSEGCPKEIASLVESEEWQCFDEDMIKTISDMEIENIMCIIIDVEHEGCGEPDYRGFMFVGIEQYENI